MLPTACLMTQDPFTTDGISLNMQDLRCSASLSSPARNLQHHAKAVMMLASIGWVLAMTVLPLFWGVMVGMSTIYAVGVGQQNMVPTSFWASTTLVPLMRPCKAVADGHTGRHDCIEFADPSVMAPQAEQSKLQLVQHPRQATQCVIDSND